MGIATFAGDSGHPGHGGFNRSIALRSLSTSIMAQDTFLTAEQVFQSLNPAYRYCYLPEGSGHGKGTYVSIAQSLKLSLLPIVRNLSANVKWHNSHHIAQKYPPKERVRASLSCYLDGVTQLPCLSNTSPYSYFIRVSMWQRRS